METRVASLASLVAAVAIAGTGIYLVLKQAAPIVETKGELHTTPGNPSTSAAAPPSASAAKPGAIYKCENGRTVIYSDTPCVGGKAVDIQPTRGYEAPRQTASRPVRATASASPMATFTTEPSDGTQRSECKLVEDAIAAVDAEARQGGPVPRMEELKERRRKLVDRRYELGC